MNTFITKNALRTLVFTACIALSAAASAHGGGWRGGGWHGGGWHGGGWHGQPWYYGGGCRTMRVCNRFGNCWLQQICY